MKKSLHITGIIAVLLGTILISASYTQSELTDTDRIVKGKAEFLLVSSEKDSSTLFIEYMYYAETDSAYKDSVNSKIVEFYQSYKEKKNGVKKKPQHSYFEDHLKSMENDFFEFENEHPTVWTFEEHIEIDDNFKSIVELGYSGWNYLGGAHGNGHGYYYIFDKSTGKYLKLKDIVSDIEELTKIAETYFRKQNLGEDEQDISWEESDYEIAEFWLNENFHFSKFSMNFFYNRYELGPYALPPSGVAIPLYEIKHLLLIEI